MIDAHDGVKIGDIKAAVEAEQMGRGMVFIANKWDLVKGVEQQKFAAQILEKAPTLRFVPIIFTSALTGKGIDKIIPAVLHVEEESRKRIGTAELNRYIENAVKEKHPPARAGRFIKFYYVTQAESRPPTFIFFCNWPKLIDPAYERFLENKLRHDFGFTGVPLRFKFRARSD
jgi:GTP-binding protein